MRTGRRVLRVHNGIHCSDGTRQVSLVIDRKARRASLEVRYERTRRELYAEEGRHGTCLVGVNNPEWIASARQRMSSRWYLCASAPLRSLLIQRLSTEINKSTKEETRVITPVIVLYGGFFPFIVSFREPLG